MTKRILLCDDELYVLRAAEIKFKRAGFEVLCASNGEEAWETVQKEPVDVIVTDCQMPIVDGIEFARRLNNHEQLCAIPVIMLTAKGFELSAEELNEEYGIDCLFAKPFSPRELLATVQDLMKTESGNESEAQPTPTIK